MSSDCEVFVVVDCVGTTGWAPLCTRLGSQRKPTGLAVVPVGEKT